MPDTTPASGDGRRTAWPTAEPLQRAADLRRAAGDPLLADWLDATANALAWLAPYRDNEPGYGMWEAALAVARQLLGTTSEDDRAATEKKLAALQRRRDEVGAECRRRGKRVLEQSEQIRAMERALDEVRRQLGQEILRAGEAEAALNAAQGLFAGTAIRVMDALKEPDAGVHPTTSEAQPDDIQVWPLTRVLADVRCGSQDWTWDEEWADLDQRHAETGYLDRLEQQIRANGITMPVLIGSDGRLWDGHHRLRIAVRLGIGYVPVEITPSAAAPAQEVARG